MKTAWAVLIIFLNLAITPLFANENISQKKLALIKIAEDNKDNEDFETTTSLMKKIQSDWKKIGHVPRKDSDKIWKQFKTACNHYFDRFHESKNAANKEEVEALEKKTKFYQASTSELYGKVEEVPQNENTPFHPYSPYAVAKQYGFWMVREYREAYGMFACNGILFNHESPRRGGTFVTKKITSGLARILAGKQDKIILGNLDAKRDWGYAKDYDYAMWHMLQQEKLALSSGLKQADATILFLK